MKVLERIEEGIGHALVQMNVVGAEAERERSAGLQVRPDTGPLLRTLLRLRHEPGDGRTSSRNFAARDLQGAAGIAAGACAEEPSPTT